MSEEATCTEASDSTASGSHDSETVPMPREDPAALTPDEVKETIQSIHVTIGWLHRLSNLVRKASFGSQNQRAANKPLEDDDGNDITECFTRFYKGLIKRDYPGLNEANMALVERMVDTMIMRRKRITYRKKRHRHWALQQVEHKARQFGVPVPQHTPSEPEETDARDNKGVSEETDEEVDQVPVLAPPPSGFTVTTVDREKYNKLAAPSRVSRATTAPFQHDMKLLVPPPPRAAREGNEFICDYCCLVLPGSEGLDKDKWA